MYRNVHRFYSKIIPLVQSLPELLHHQAQVVDIIIETLKISTPKELKGVFNVICVLAR